MAKKQTAELEIVSETSPSSCGSCRRSLTNSTGSVRFSCPGCSKTVLARCFSCRQISVPYTCPMCSFTGPN